MATAKRQAQTALITGASSGIGVELARCFAEGGHDLVLTARRAERLDTLASELRDEHGVSVLTLPADLLDPATPSDLASALSQRDIRIDTLVNNAGVTDTGAFHETDADKIDGLVQLNVVSLAAMTHTFLPLMVAHGKGRLLNVASVASFQPVPNMSVYAASKAFVLSLTEAQSEELRGTGVTATALCPGLTDTAMVRDVMQAQPAAGAVPSFAIMDARSVARAGYRACMAGKVIEVPGLANEWASNWVRFQPRWLVRAMGGWAARLVDAEAPPNRA